MGSVTKHWNGTPREVLIQLCKRLMVELDDQEGLFQDRWFKDRCSMGWVEIMKKLCALPHWIISSVISFFLLPEGILNCLVYEGKESRSNQLSILFSCYLRIFFFYVLSICVQIWMVKKKMIHTLFKCIQIHFFLKILSNSNNSMIMRFHMIILW